MTYNELAPYVIGFTVFICFSMCLKIKKKDVLTIDGVFSILGFATGMVITFLNLKYSNNYLITLGPLMAITSLLYLIFRDRILSEGNDFSLSGNIRGIVKLSYWIFILFSLVSYYLAPIYYRSPIFFICISLAVAVLGIDILSLGHKNGSETPIIILKVLLASSILRTSAYIISPYTVGLDPWFHEFIINNSIIAGHIVVPRFVSDYLYFPLMHLFTISNILIGNLSTKESMFIVGIVLMLSTLFPYMLIKKITNSNTVALLSLLFLNFADFEIQWSTTVIAMSFGIALFSIILYFIIKNTRHEKIYTALLILFFIAVVLTHIISSIITTLAIVCIYLGYRISQYLYKNINEDNDQTISVDILLCSLFIIILLGYLAYAGNNFSDNNFLETELYGLVYSFSTQAKFLSRTVMATSYDNSIDLILNIFGFIIFVVLGVIGSLKSLSRKYETNIKFGYIIMLIILFFIFFVFPLVGLRNILPYRWPAFIYIGFVFPVAVGFMGLLNTMKKRHALVLSLLIVFTLTFFMITNSFSNIDSPIYAKDQAQRIFWKESEVDSYKNMINLYPVNPGEILTDGISDDSIFKTMLQTRYSTPYRFTINGTMDWASMDNCLIAWSNGRFSPPITDYSSVPVSEKEVEAQLTANYYSVFDSGDVKGFYMNASEKV